MNYTNSKETLQQLLLEMEAFTTEPFSGYLGEIDKDAGEKVIAVVDDDTCKKVLNIATSYMRESSQADLDQKFDKDPSLEISKRRARDRADMFMEMFWVLIKEKYDLWRYPNIGIREGWQVVARREKKHGPLAISLRDLLEGD